VTNAWRIDYDEYEIDTNHKSAYIGSIFDVDGVYHTGNDIYQSTSPSYVIYTFDWYAGQGVDHVMPSNGGGKYLLYSEYEANSDCKIGFSWETTYDSVAGLYSFVTAGSLNTLYLGYTPDGDYAPSPEQGTLTAFDPTGSLLVVSNFNCVVNAVAETLTGIEGADGNTQFDAPSWLANAGLYDQVTLNSAVIYGLAFDNTPTSAFEVILNAYLESLPGDVSLASGKTAIDTALSDADSCVVIEYYEEAGYYNSAAGEWNGVVTEALAEQYLCDCGCDVMV
jgi:hypothetical protein